MRYMYALMVVVFAGLVGMLVVVNHHNVELANDMNVLLAKNSECQASNIDLEDELLRKNEVVFRLAEQKSDLEDRYYGSTGYKTRRMLSKINPFDDNITE